MSDHRPPTDRRRQTRDTERNLVLGGFAIALIVGGLLIWRFWGGWAAGTGLLCMGGILGLFALLWGLLKLMEIIGRQE